MKQNVNLWSCAGLLLTAMVIVVDRFVMPLNDMTAIGITCIAIMLFAYGIWTERKKRS